MTSLDAARRMLRNRNLYLMLLGDASLFTLSWLLAFGLRFEFAVPVDFARHMYGFLPHAVGLKFICFLVTGLYRGMWRYTSLADLWRMGRAVIMAETALILYVTFGSHFVGHPRSVYLLDPLLTFVLAGGARVVIRSVYEISARPGSWRSLLLPRMACPPPEGRRVLLIGADDAGVRFAREIMEGADSGLHLLGFVDDDKGRIGRSIHDLPVYGPLSTLARLIEMTRAEEILVGADVSGERMRYIMGVAEGAGLGVKKLPALGDIISGKVSVKVLRDVRYEDLLGREEIRLDEAGIMECLGGRTVLVTGAGGSIGSELCRQIIRFNPHHVILFDAGEENLYDIEMELRHKRGFERYAAVLGRVQDRSLVDAVFAMYHPQVVFHAAAYKHVPMLELNPWQAVSNNIQGSQTVMAAAARFGAERFVLVSTDKAVRPTNVMGASKRVTELLMQGMPDCATRFMAVRFGNVLGSSGSVIPLFREQIRRGGPVTVTHPEVTRYFMTIPEAAQLIVQAGALGRGGEIFVLKMGKPVRIVDLARDLIILSGQDPAEISIEFTGLRPGEKLYEELITAGEGIVETGHEKIMVLLPTETGKAHAPDATVLNALATAAESFDGAEIRSLLARLVSEYMPVSDPVREAVARTGGLVAP